MGENIQPIYGNQLIKRSLVQLGVSELQTTVTVSISTIMSTASSCQPTITGSATIWKRVNSRVKTVSGAKPCVFSGNVAPGVAEVGSLFPRFRGSIWESCWQKAHRTVAIARLALQNRRNTFGKKLCTRLQRELKNCHVRSSPGFARSSPNCQRCANVYRFGTTLLLCRFATSCDKTHGHRCTPQSMSDAATLLASGIAAGGCETHTS